MALPFCYGLVEGYVFRIVPVDQGFVEVGFACRTNTGGNTLISISLNNAINRPAVNGVNQKVFGNAALFGIWIDIYSVKENGFAVNFDFIGINNLGQSADILSFADINQIQFLAGCSGRAAICFPSVEEVAGSGF